MTRRGISIDGRDLTNARAALVSPIRKAGVRDGGPMPMLRRASARGGLEIAEIVASRPGIRMIEVAGLVYADDPDGGPEWGEASLTVQTCRANARLAPFGFAIRAGQGCRNGYRVTKIGEGAA